MKKKILSFLLCVVLALGALCAFAGCDDAAAVLPPPQETEQGGTQQGGQTDQGGQQNNGGTEQSGQTGQSGGQQNQGGAQQGDQASQGGQQNQGGAQQGGQQSDGGRQPAPNYRVGDRITDDATIQKLKESMAAEFKGVRGSVEYSLEEESFQTENEKDIEFELLSDFANAAFDLRMSRLEEQSERIVDANYGVAFGRDGELYTGEGSWQDAGVRREDWNGLLAKYKSGALLMEKMTREEMQQNGGWTELLLFSSFDSSALGALAEYTGGSFYKTEDGYELKISLLGPGGLFEKAFSDLERLIETLDFEAPLSTLIESEEFKAQLDGKTANEVEDVLRSLITGDEGVLPESLDGETAADYILRLMKDENVYEAAMGEKGTFGALTISEILQNSGAPADKQELLESLAQFRTHFEENLLESLTGGYDRILKRDLEIEFEFDLYGNFYAFDFDGEVEWTKDASTFDLNLGLDLNFLKTAPVLSDISGVKTQPNA